MIGTAVTGVGLTGWFSELEITAMMSDRLITPPIAHARTLTKG
jgi:hypothetical protein